MNNRTSQSARSASHFLASTRGTLVLIALVLVCAYGFALRNSLDYAIDGKTFYLAGKAIIVGGDPYDPAQEKALAERFAPDRELAHLMAHHLIPPPITPLAFAVPSLLPWNVFRLLLLLLNVFSIPLIAYLILRLRPQRPAPGALWLTSGFIAVLPPTWQNLKLGQLALLILLCTLAAAHCLAQKRFKRASLWTLLALLKPTICLPVLAYLFLKGRGRARSSLFAAAVAYVVLNLLAIARIQTQGIAFFESYRRSLNDSFGAGGINDPRVMGAIRLDAEVLLAQLSVISPQIAKYTLAVLLVGAFWFATKRLPQSKGEAAHGWVLSSLLVLALVLFYHRSYDAVLLVPAFVLAVAGLWEQWKAPPLEKLELREHAVLRWLYGALAIVVLLCLAAIGSDDRNLLDKFLQQLGTSTPFWFKAACVLVSYAILTAILRLHSRGETA